MFFFQLLKVLFLVFTVSSAQKKCKVKKCDIKAAVELLTDTIEPEVAMLRDELESLKKLMETHESEAEQLVGRMNSAEGKLSKLDENGFPCSNYYQVIGTIHRCPTGFSLSGQNINGKHLCIQRN